LLTQKISPELAVANADNKIFFGEPKSAQVVNAKGNQLDIGVCVSFTHNVAVELEMFAQPSALLFLVAKERTDGKPLERFFELAFVRGDHARERRRQLGAERDFTFAFVGKTKKLTNNFIAAFLFIELGRFKHRSLPFNETIATRDFAPFGEDVIPRRALVRQKIAKSRQALHKSNRLHLRAKLARFDATGRRRSYETIIRLNKAGLWTVGYRHDGEHPFNQSKGQTMKQTRLMKMLAAGTVCAVAAATAVAQERTTVTTAGGVGVSTTTSANALNGTGVISAYTPGSDYITFRGEADTAPVRYYYTKTTPVVDVEGKTVEWSAIRPDMPVNYTYVREGDRMVVTKVTLQKPLSYYEKTTTTTTTTSRP